jgi:hypothetical protein
MKCLLKDVHTFYRRRNTGEKVFFVVRFLTTIKAQHQIFPERPLSLRLVIIMPTNAETASCKWSVAWNHLITKSLPQGLTVQFRL